MTSGTRGGVPYWTPPAEVAHYWGGDLGGTITRFPGDNMADQQGGALKPVTAARVAEELRKISTRRQNGELDKDEYEHRFSRMISELRDRRIEGSRAEILAALTPLRDQGVVTPQDWQRLVRQLGLA